MSSSWGTVIGQKNPSVSGLRKKKKSTKWLGKWNLATWHRRDNEYKLKVKAATAYQSEKYANTAIRDGERRREEKKANFAVRKEITIYRSEQLPGSFFDPWRWTWEAGVLIYTKVSMGMPSHRSVSLEEFPLFPFDSAWTLNVEGYCASVKLTPKLKVGFSEFSHP